MRTVPQCLTCSSPVRLDIETGVLRGLPYKVVAREALLSDPNSRVTPDSIRRHVDRGHMPHETQVVRLILEERAKERGIPYEEAADTLVDAQGFAEIVVRQALERIAQGEIRPSLGEGLDAARLLLQFAEHEEAATEDDYVEAFLIYHDAVRAVMTDEQYAEFTRRLNRNERLRALMAKYEEEHTGDSEGDDFYGQGEDPEVVAGELVEAGQ